MPVIDRDELLARVDDWLENTPAVVHAGTVQMVERLVAALRAASIARPQPDGIPAYAMLDVWMALGGDSAAFDRMWNESHRTPADTWAQLMAAVGQRLSSLAADTNPPIGPEFDHLIFPASAGSATPTGDDDE